MLNLLPPSSGDEGMGTCCLRDLQSSSPRLLNGFPRHRCIPGMHSTILEALPEASGSLTKTALVLIGADSPKWCTRSTSLKDLTVLILSYGPHFGDVYCAVEGTSGVLVLGPVSC